MEELYRRSYKLKDFRQALGVNWRQVVYFVDKKLIEAAFGGASGPGTARHWSFQNIVELAIIKRLSEQHGFRYEKIKIILDLLRQHEPDPWRGKRAKLFPGWLGYCLENPNAGPLIYYFVGRVEGLAVGEARVEEIYGTIKSAESSFLLDVSKVIERVKEILT